MKDLILVDSKKLYESLCCCLCFNLSRNKIKCARMTRIKFKYSCRIICGLCLRSTISKIELHNDTARSHAAGKSISSMNNLVEKIAISME